MKKPLQTTILAALAAFSFSSLAKADNLQWTASGIEYVGDVGGVTGSFDYDADLNSFSNIDLTSSPDGSVFQYLDPNSHGNGANGFIFVDSDDSDLTGAQWLLVDLDSAMTDEGGTVDIDVLEEGTCSDSTCSGVAPTYEALSGDFSASEATPEPAAIALSGVGAIAILCLALRRRRGEQTGLRA